MPELSRRENGTVTKKLRLELKFRNNRILQAIENCYPNQSIKKVCKSVMLSEQSIYDYISFKRHPINRWGAWKPSATRLAAALDVDEEYLFPAELLDPRQATYRWDFDPEEINQILHPSKDELPLDKIIETDKAHELKKIIESSCSAKEQDIILSRYGILTEKKTLQELAESYNVTRQRVMQIEKKVLLKMKKKIKTDDLKR